MRSGGKGVDWKGSKERGEVAIKAAHTVRCCHLEQPLP